MKKFFLYLLRWQLSTIILAPCIYYLPFNTLIKTIVSNLIGGCIFFWVDKLIFKDKPHHVEEKILDGKIRKMLKEKDDEK